MKGNNNKKRSRKNDKNSVQSKEKKGQLSEEGERHKKESCVSKTPTEATKLRSRGPLFKWENFFFHGENGISTWWMCASVVAVPSYVAVGRRRNSRRCSVVRSFFRSVLRFDGWRRSQRPQSTDLFPSRSPTPLQPSATYLSFMYSCFNAVMT